MAFRTKVKNFIQNSLFFFLGIILTTGVFQIWFGTDGGDGTTERNNGTIEQLWVTATALGTNLSLGQEASLRVPVNLFWDILLISSTLGTPSRWEDVLLTENMKHIGAYTRLLKTDIPSLLDQAIDRATTLDEYIALLSKYEEEWSDHITTLERQKWEFESTLTEVVNRANTEKSWVLVALQEENTESIHTLLEEYITTKNRENHIRTYLSFIEKFLDSYERLQSVNSELIRALTLNREPLIKNATIIIPNRNTTIIERLDLLNNQ